MTCTIKEVDDFSFNIMKWLFKRKTSKQNKENSDDIKYILLSTKSNVNCSNCSKKL